MRYDVGRFRRPMRRSTEGQLMSLISLGDGSTLTLDFTTGVLDPRLTFSRASGGTYTGNDGLVYGMDFATSSSLAIGTGSKSVTLTATAGVDRRYLVGQTVYISNGANNMSGPVTAYNASTQVLTINATATSGSGSFTSWSVGNASARFDYDPTTLTPRGLLIEGSATNYLTGFTAGGWGRQNVNGSGTAGALANGETGPDGVANTAARITTAAATTFPTNMFVAFSTNAAGASRTFSVWLRGVGSNTTASIAIVGSNTPAGVASSQSGHSVTLATSTSGNNLLALVTGLSTTAWTRVSISRTDAQASADSYRICPGNHTGTISSGLAVDVYVPQAESGIGMSSTIPTGASTGQRLADSCVMTGPNFSSWFAGATEGVLYAECERPTKINSPAADHGVVSTLYTSGTWLGIQITATNQFPSSVVWPTGGFTSAGGIATRVPLVSKQAVRWFNGASITNFGNGTQGSTAVGTGSVALGLLTIGANVSSGTTANLDWLNGCIRRVKFWPTALPNAQIIALTT